MPGPVTFAAPRGAYDRPRGCLASSPRRVSRLWRDRARIHYGNVALLESAVSAADGFSVLYAFLLWCSIWVGLYIGLRLSGSIR